ncbi:MAG: glycosyltransferase family 4 protein [Chloroflexota bacterium]|nr:glycosyltransferase family 4 protein [Chloroflexota bacterium]MBI5704279.1 glycosyltransferase family 4 protein [Chloroflexota bacterium]
MKIGLVIYGSLDTVSGGYLYDRKLVEYLRAQGDTVEIISLPWRNYASHLTDNLRFRLPPDLDLIIEDELNHPSLLFANQLPHPCPIVGLVHHLRCSELRSHWQNALYRIVEKKYLQSVDGFIFNSKTTKGAVSGVVGDGKPFIIGHPPTDRFWDKAVTEEAIRERAKSNELRILFLGNVIYRKGLHTLLRAVASQTSKVRVEVVGGLTAEPKYAEEMRRFAVVNGLASAVTFHGTLDNEPLVEMYRRAHLMVVPSSYEGFGIVYLEGMGFGLPAIGTSAGAAGEVITHEEDGYLIKPDDAVTLARILDELENDRELLVRLSLNALKRYKSQPRWEETARKIREFLYQMAGASAAPHSA